MLDNRGQRTGARIFRQAPSTPVSQSCCLMENYPNADM